MRKHFTEQTEFGRTNRRIARLLYGLSWLFTVLFVLESIYAHNPPILIYYVIAIPLLMTIPTYHKKVSLRFHGIMMVLLWLLPLE